jgi:hypothetical protein
MSAVPAVRATVAARSIVRRSETRKLAAPSRSVAARAITETVAESQGADSALYDEFKKLLVDYEFSYKVGDRVSGKVFHCDSKGAWVDIGAKAAALCPASESSLAEVRNVSTEPYDPCFLRATARCRPKLATRALAQVARPPSRRRRAPRSGSDRDHRGVSRKARVDKAHDARCFFAVAFDPRNRGD